AVCRSVSAPSFFLLPGGRAAPAFNAALFYHRSPRGGIVLRQGGVIILFIVSTKLTKAKAVAGVLAVGAVLCGLIFAAGHLHSRGAAAPSPEHVADNDGRVAYLAAWGWEVDPSAVETLDLVLPSSGASFESYNALQEENGMD